MLGISVGVERRRITPANVPESSDAPSATKISRPLK